MKKKLIFAITLTIITYSCIKLVSSSFMNKAVPLPITHPENIGVCSTTLNQIDTLVQQAIDDEKLPGAVIVIGYKGAIIYKKAFGNRMLIPKKRPMTTDAIFDVASLTKPIITATGIMLLAEQHKLSLDDNVSFYLPEFANNGKEEITIKHLLTHRSGLPAVTNLEHYHYGPVMLMHHLNSLKISHKPGTHYCYSDVGYIILGKIIEIVTNRSLKDFAKQEIFKPLQLKNTYFNPHPFLWPLIPPHDRDERENLIHGRVHDPRAYYMGGVAGHAGLFSTADNLAIFCQMLLNKGSYNGKRFLQEETVAQLTQSLPGLPEGEQVSLGWNINTQHSFPRGAHFTEKSFGHTGFTGVSLWIDPVKEMFVIFLSNQLHPNGKTQTKDLRYQVSTLAAQSVERRLAA